MDIVHDKEFKMPNNLLTGRMKKELKEGKSAPTLHHPVIEAGDLKRLRCALSNMALSPLSLMRKVWFEIAIHFISRGLELHKQLHKDSFRFDVDDEGNEYATLRYNTLTKTTQGGLCDPEMHGDKRMYATNDADCPVDALKRLINIASLQGESLFCEPVLHSVNPLVDTVWFSPRPVSRSWFQQVMPNMSREFNLSMEYTPHCVRATAIHALSETGVETRHIMYLSGHRNEASIRSYSRSSSACQKRQISSLLSGRDPLTTPSSSLVPYDRSGERHRHTVPSSSCTVACSQSEASDFLNNAAFHGCTVTINYNNARS